MAKLTKAQVFRLAEAAGLELDDLRAETIAARLGGVLEEMEMIPEEALHSVEPISTFMAPPPGQNAAS